MENAIKIFMGKNLKNIRKGVIRPTLLLLLLYSYIVKRGNFRQFFFMTCLIPKKA